MPRYYRASPQEPMVRLKRLHLEGSRLVHPARHRHPAADLRMLELFKDAAALS